MNPLSKKTEMESFTSEYAMSGADNALSRKHLNHAVIAQDAVFGDALANEGQHRKTLNKGLEELAEQKND